ncbi:MAG: CPBP family intramembrane metalloprotease [Bacteroidetes bacterium]|nr:CPBP family intramembrane metalloprotease [Bacteroidota bacterium]
MAETAKEQESSPGYFALTRRNSYNFVLAGILLGLYELSKLFNSGDVQVVNAIDKLMKWFFELIPNGTLYVSAALAVIGLFYIVRDFQQGYKLRTGMLGFMWLEALVWAGVIYFNLSIVINWIPAMSAGKGVTFWQELSLSLGAGFYEEFFFRLILVKLTVFALMIAGMEQNGTPTRILTVLITAVIFSLVHFDFILGSMGDPWSWYAFFFRTAFGVLMSLLLMLRGFGITAWAHALYDVLVVLFN